MPRKRAAKNTALPEAAGPLELSASAREMVENIERGWSLDPPTRAQLRLVAEHMTRAEQCDAVLAREGLVLPDLKGAAKVHPLALLSRDHRNAASAGLARLLARLEG